MATVLSTPLFPLPLRAQVGWEGKRRKRSLPSSSPFSLRMHAPFLVGGGDTEEATATSTSSSSPTNQPKSRTERERNCLRFLCPPHLLVGRAFFSRAGEKAACYVRNEYGSFSGKRITQRPKKGVYLCSEGSDGLLPFSFLSPPCSSPRMSRRNPGELN